MTCEVYFIVYLEKGRLMRLSNDITLFSRDEGLFLSGAGGVMRYPAMFLEGIF